MHYAVVGCIQANADALKAVLADIRARGIDRIVCLGDVIGFGPDPLECIDLVRKHCFMFVRGDHDQAMLEGSVGFTPKTAKILDWTRALVEGGDPAVVQARRAFFEGALDSFNSAGIGFVHGSPRSCHEYLFPSDVQRDPRKLRAGFAATEKVTFFANTQVPGVIMEEPLSWHTAQELEGFFHYRKGMKALVCVGSVGQPRDGDCRACYLEIDKNRMYWRRVEYDLTRVVQRLDALPEVFSSDFAIRLQKGR
ncbi:MAG: metallophosphoesterase [Planctomycetota bacterium]